MKQQRGLDVEGDLMILEQLFVVVFGPERLDAGSVRGEAKEVYRDWLSMKYLLNLV